MAAEAAEPRKRRKYTAEEREEILAAVEDVGVVEAARRHGVPQTTVSNWLHRDAAKVAKARPTKQAAAKQVAGRGEETASTVKQQGRRATPTSSKAATSSGKAVTKAAKRWAAPAAAVPPANTSPSRPANRVARSYTPSEKAQALEHAAAHGVSAASEELEISRFSIYDWRRKLKKASAGQGSSPTSGASPQTIEEQRDQEILGEWRKHPGLGPSQIRNQLRRRGIRGVGATHTVHGTETRARGGRSAARARYRMAGRRNRASAAQGITYANLRDPGVRR